MVQRICFDLIIANYELELVNGHLNQLFLYIDDVVGIAKSYLIKIISFYLKRKVFQYHKTDLILQAALTEIAAFNIYGETFHQLLCLPIRSKFYSLIAATLFSL